MSTILGNIGEFSETTETWKQYVERLDQFLLVNDIVDGDKKRAMLLTAVGPKTYGLLRDLAKPVELTTKSYTELSAMLETHYTPKPSVIMQRYKFNSRLRQPGESISAYAAALRNLTEHCNFGDTINEMIRDRFVVGIEEERIQRRLLSETTLTLEKAIQMAESMSLADKELKYIKRTTEQSHRVNKLSSQAKPRHTQSQASAPSHSSLTCFRCNGSHLADKCYYKDEMCRFCKRIGHIERACFKKKKDQGRKQGFCS